MDKIFGSKYVGMQLTEFSSAHIGVILFLVLTNFLIIFTLKRVTNTKKIDIFRYCAASIMIFYTLSFEIWSISAGIFTFKNSLPLHLCDVSVILAALLLLTKNKLIFEITYFWGLGGSFLAILTPDISQSFPHFNFINYFLSHGGIITCVLFMVFIENYNVNLKSVFRVFAITNLYMLFIVIINLVLKSNYLYICQKPINPSLIDLLGPWPWYVLSLEGVSLTVFFVLYLPFFIKQLKAPAKPMNFGA
jgi:hypothetical integral membrane protein (TIGR02206 family)